jgi:predicted transposase YbfD/YdcC
MTRTCRAGICQTTGVVLAQIAVPGKTNEVPMLRKPLATLDIAGSVITADALHTTRDTAVDIIARGARCILTAKGN